MNDNTCYFCGSDCVTKQSIAAYEEIQCQFCGNYIISFSALSTLEDYKNKRHIIAGYLEETRNSRNNPLKIYTDFPDTILNDYRIPKTTMEKLEKVLIYCYDKNEYIGQEFVTHNTSTDKIYFKSRYYLNGETNRTGVAYTRNTDELIGILDTIADLGWIELKYTSDNSMHFILKAEGLIHAEQLLKTNLNSNKVFVAIEFHNDYEKRLNEAIKPACKECNFKAFIISDVLHNNNINNEIIVAIKRSKFVIADFTHNNHGVYYEAGYASGMGLQVIKTCNKNWFDKIIDNTKHKSKLHFDVDHDNFILYSDNDDYKKKLKDWIRATITGAILEDNREYL